LSNSSEAKKFKPETLEQKRQVGRIDIRPSEGLLAKIKIGAVFHEVPMYDLSINGVGLVLSEQVVSQMRVGTVVDVIISCSWGYDFEGKYECTRIEKYRTDFRVGFKNISTTKVVDYNVPDSHVGDLLTVPSDLPVVGYLYKDFFYIERVAFTIAQISTKALLIDVKDTELFLFSGMKVELMLALHTTSGRNIDGVISKVAINEDKSVRILVKVTKIPKKLEFDIVNHLLQNPAVTPDGLRNAGFRVTSIANNFRFRFVKSHQEYMEVLRLRKIAYAEAGKVSESADLEKLVAPLDSISRILVAYHGGKIVASVSMSFPQSENTILDTERALEGGYPKEFPKKTSVIEISRLCTDPDYRRGDLLVRMFEQIYRVFVTAGRDYLVSSCDDKLWKIYKGIGFRKTKYSYPHPYLAGIIHHLIIIDKAVPTRARGFNFIKWNYLYRNMTLFLKGRVDLKYSWLDRLKLRIYISIGKILGIRNDDKY
jgi:hypothetical protein